jgi:septum formation protein
MYKNSEILVLGSGSPRRREMLEQLGLSLIVDPPDVDEALCEGLSPHEYLTEVTRRKLSVTIQKRQHLAVSHAGIVCADTVVCLEGEILQKPLDASDAYRMLKLLMGNTHQVMTAYALYCAKTRQTVERIVTSQVTFRAAREWELHSYVRSGEGVDKAGAYAVQGLGAIFVERIAGSYSNVVGLPLCELWLDLIQLRIVAAHEVEPQ